MLTATLLLTGVVLTLMGFAERYVRAMPLSPALCYLLIGILSATIQPGLFRVDPIDDAVAATVITEAAVLLSLFAVGLRVRLPLRNEWTVAVLLATTGMLVFIALATLAGHALLGLPWPAALLLAAMLAPTDPVLASEVQVRHENDADAVRTALTVEGALNDATALPVVMLALGLLGLHQLNGWQAAWYDLLWPIGGGVLFGLLLGRIGGGVLRGLLARGHKLAWDELVFLGGLLFSFGVARALGVSTFMTVFIAAASLLGADPADDTPAEAGLAERMRNFGERGERLVEVTIVLFLGAAMTRISWSLAQVGFALLLVLVVRPLSVWAVVRKARLSPLRRRLVAWFGIRGVGSLFYLVFAIEHGLEAPLAYELVGACVIAVALSIVTHGVSATPLMNWYQKRRRR